MIIDLGKKNSILNQYIAELRDTHIQQDSLRFRRNLYRTGSIFAYEISQRLSYSEKEVITSLGSASVSTLDDKVIIGSLLRSGLGLHEGFLNVFDRAQNAFISIYRKFEKGKKSKVKIEYISAPEITDKVLIICDTVLATGISAFSAYKELNTYGKPRHTHIAVVVASQEGVDYLTSRVPKSKMTLWVGAIDDELTAQAFVVPGMGDAGDLAYGSKEE